MMGRRSKLAAGLYDTLLDEDLAELLEGSAADLIVDYGNLDPEVLPRILAQQLRPHLELAFEACKEAGPDAQVELANDILRLLVERTSATATQERDLLRQPPARLFAVTERRRDLGEGASPERPSIPLTASELLVNGPRQLRIGPELRRELKSADRVELLCAFLRFSGVSIIRDELAAFLRRKPGGLRVITTTYMGATEKKALDELVKMGAQVRISYDNKTTRLHAKAWLFRRDSGFSTAFIGSSNLSAAALLDGLEWNVRVSEVDNPGILSRFDNTFQQYWNDAEFEPYDPTRDAKRFQEAVQKTVRDRDELLISALRVRPYPHQREILDELDAEREAGHNRNLVVAATGTGKTVVAALDYKRLRARHGDLSLLFVAHREEILRQSRAVFRAAAGDASFGELLVRGVRPDFGRHVFASVQSLHADRLAELDPNAYDVVIVDEFHHAAAPTYRRLLEHLQPNYLLGLTATPERADGESVLDWFDDRIAAEVRLWQALDRGLLCPFQYFGVGDDTDLSSVTFRRGGYDQRELERVITGDQFRARRIIQALDRYVSDPHGMRALGFCVGLHHAAVMATAFRNAGLPAAAVAGQAPIENGSIVEPFMDRSQALGQLRDGKLCCVFAVDLFNEGVDVPSIDTVLFLRPTESATVFLQQLGRGLRHFDGKSHLTVLDFIGNAHKRYRYDLKFRALVGGTRSHLMRQIEADFPRLPPGCEIKLDRQSSDWVLRNIRESLGRNEVSFFAEELRDLAADRGQRIELKTYLDAIDLGLEEFYSRTNRSWTEVRRRANVATPPAGPYEAALMKSIARLRHVDDHLRIRTWREWLRQPSPPPAADPQTFEGRLQTMLLGTWVDHRHAVVDTADVLAQIWAEPAMREELVELLDAAEDRLRHRGFDLDVGSPIPIRAHATYSLAEIMAGFGVVRNGKLVSPQAGVWWEPSHNADLLFITLQKTESEYSPETLYRDYPISETLFHWESQHMTTADSDTGRRYVEHERRGSHVVLFVRQTKKDADINLPYLCLGRAQYKSHESERPMRVVWELEHPMPADFYQLSKTAAG